ISYDGRPISTFRFWGKRLPALETAVERMPPSDRAFAPLPAQVGDLVSDPSGKINQPAVEVLELATEGVHVVDVRLDRAFEIRLFLEGFRVRLAVSRGRVGESFPVVRFSILDQFAHFPEAGEFRIGSQEG